jgi:peptidoglycan/xylan/chitin deacetylase (PgdA/CDA1 family)
VHREDSPDGASAERLAIAVRSGTPPVCGGVSDVIAIQRTPAGLASAMLALQRTAGNQAAVRTLARKTKKTVHLTFDDGPKRETTPMALDALDKEGIKATFYIQGNHVKGNEDILCDIVRRGHFIGNHTFTHPTFSRDGKPLVTNEQIKEEFQRTEEVIKSALQRGKTAAGAGDAGTADAGTADAGTTGFWTSLPQDRRDYIDSIIAGGTGELRVPQFSQTKDQTAFIESTLVKPRAAHVDSKDADTVARDSTLSEEEKTERVVSNVVFGIPKTEFKGVADHPQNPVIVLQHDTLAFSVKAIPSIIAKLRAEGHEFGGRLPARGSASKPVTPKPAPPRSLWDRLFRSPVAASGQRGSRRGSCSDPFAQRHPAARSR